MNRCTTYRNLEHYDEALASYDHAIALNTNNPDAYNLGGAVLGKQHKLKKVLAYFDKAAQLSNSDAA